MKYIFACLLCLNLFGGYGQTLPTLFETSQARETPDYWEIIRWWKTLDQHSDKVHLRTMGMTDAGQPLHLAVISQAGDTDFAHMRKENKRVILVNNGIHPGEPDGIDASMLLARDIAFGKIRMPDQLVLAIIPVYNIGGCLDRSPDYRVDQNGPEAFGFRGNSQNLDLNRDFIKCDSKEARAFAEIFHLADPDVFLDNHVSNGADYQHIMTLICSQHNKLGGIMGEFMNKDFEPGIYASMKKKGYDLIPYVNAFGDRVDQGWPEFMDGPRYSSGYAALWHSFSFVAETHMLKAYDQRVQATYELMLSFMDFTSGHSKQIKELREATKNQVKSQREFTITWNPDRTRSSERLYKGYESGYRKSEVSGLDRLYYDRTRPYEKTIPFYNHYLPGQKVQKASAYVIPQGWWKVIDLLRLNKVNMMPLDRDTLMEVEVYRIEEYESSSRPFEGHHINTKVRTSISVGKMSFRKGDYLVPLDQVANRFLVEVLEPAAPDSYFTWNFFDAVLGQKEGYSAYAFEDIAAEYLQRHPDLKEKLAERRQSDSTFARSARAQLYYVYEHSPWIEPAFMRYPVYRVRSQ